MTDPAGNDRTDPSNGWEAVADEVITGRCSSGVGAGAARGWARSLPAAATILDLGCGSGVPVSEILTEQGFTVYGIDASPTLIDAFRKRLPDAHAACEAVQESMLFDRKFDAVVSVGLMFLLREDEQLDLIAKVADTLEPEGRFLFTAPVPRAVWPDALTGRPSHSLGAHAYRTALAESGLMVVGEFDDEGGNHYYDARKSV